MKKVSDPGHVAANVELKELGAFGGSRGNLQGRLGRGAEDGHGAEVRCRFSDSDASSRCKELKRADRGRDHGNAQAMAEESRRWVDVRDVDENAGTERD